MDEEMEELMLTAEPIVAEEFEVDFDYEFDAPQYYDFTLPETPAKARENELWFDSAASYPPSPFILKFNWRYDFPADTASVSCDSRGGSMSSIGNVSYFETDSEAFDIYQINRGPEFCVDMDQDVSKSKTKSFAKSSIQRSSTLMKPTASYLAKYNQLQEFHFNHFLRSQKIVKSDKSSLNSSTIENLATKRQKLEAGFLPKVSHLKHQTHFLHKVPVKVGLLEINSVNCRSKVTIPREPNLETAHRAQRHRAKAKVDTESDEHAKSNACNFKARPLNRKILEAPLPHPPKKSTPQPTEFQEFQLRTSERARQHACNNVATVHNHNAISQNETKDSRSLILLGDNRFNDSILRYLNTLNSLTTLILRFNNIEGSRTKQGLANLRYLQVLDLHWNKINSGSLTRLGLVNLTNLKTLDLSDCQITTLQGLPNLRCLRVLDLSWNSNLTSGSLTTPGFANLTNLKILDLSGCGITTLQGLTKLKNLEALDLSYNNISGSSESQGVCELKNLSELILQGINIKGHLPDCLKNLSHLKVLDISYNQLSGTLPSAITTLTSLEYLALLDNNFEGTFLLSSLANHSKLEVLLLSSRTNMLSVKTENFLPTFQLKVLGLPNYNLKVIPSFLLHQYDLKLLDLSGNNLVGDFPTWVLRNNTKLEALFLTNNSFTGNLQLPKTQHDFLHHLDVSNNNLTGKLPEDMGIILQKLLYIDMSDNRFEGYLPSSIGEMKALIFLRLPKNNFSGELPAPLLTGCISLGLLDLSGNNFYGQIFPKYMNLTRLEFLYLENNKFSGKIEEGLSNSNELKELDISNNLLSGHIPHWIGNFSSDLKVLLMSKMFLKGNIPAQLLSHGSLNLLSVSENCLSGPMTSSFNLSSLEHLYLQMNSLSGPIPIALFRSSNLITLDLRDNRFSGVIPHQISESLTLRFLLLRGNYLEGQIPNQLCQLRRLGVLDLSHNRISGSIPSCLTIMLLWVAGNVYLHEPYLQFFSALFVDSIGTYYNSTFHFGHYGNGVYSIFPQLVKVEFMTKNRYELYNGSNIKYMVGLDLSCNQLTGGIPSEIGDLQIRGLNLSYNFLSGSIPGSFSNLKMIESLDLSHNRLSGQVPPRLTELNFLSNFNVSFNNLSGLIPDKGQFATFDESSYRGNLHLCGPTINKSCNSTEEVPATTSIQGEVEDECAIDTVSLYWSFGASYVTVILGLFAILWINSIWRRQWFYFIDACIDACYYWLYKYVFDL